MPYSTALESRIDVKLPNLDKKKMFGGICYLMNGNMAMGIYKDFLIIRAGEKNVIESMNRPHTRPFNITGKPMRGWIMVEEPGYADDADLENWLELGQSFVVGLPPK